MQALNERIAFPGNTSGQTLAIFILVVYIAIMPKELMQLACVFVGATGYLFFLLLQPSTETYSSTTDPPASEKPESAEVEGTVDLAKATKPTEFVEVFLNKTTEVAPIAELLAPVAAEVATTDSENTLLAKQSWADVESSDDESTAVSSDGNHETTSDESIVKVETPRMPSKNTAPAEENPSKPANVVCCPRFQRKKTVGCPRFQTADAQETETQKSSEQLQERENQRQKDNCLRLAASKKLMYDDGKPPPARMGTAMPDGATRKKLSVNAAPFVRRNKLSTDAAPFICGPCVQQQASSLSMQPEKDSEVCWQWVSRGFCPRGPRCQWEHPRTEKVREQSQSYETGWKYPRTKKFQKQFQDYETVKPLPTHVAIGIPVDFFELKPMVQTPASGFAGNFFELNGQTMVQTPAPGQCGTYFVDHSMPVANNSINDDDSEDILTDDGF